MSKDTIFWGIHPGREGEAESQFRNKKVIALGWDKIGDLSKIETRENIKDLYGKVYPDAKKGTIPVHVGILYRFIYEMKKGDIVIFPSKLLPEILIGRVIGDYEYDSKEYYPHIRKVEWLKTFPRTKFSQGALYEIGAAMTFFQVKNYADEFSAILEGKDYVFQSDEIEKEAINFVADDIEQQSRDFVLKQINQKLKGHGLAEFIGHLLNLMGYNTDVSEPGPDRGIDIIAYKDDLGVEPPRMIVQVKSSENEINERAVSELYGKVTEKEFGLFISLGGFNRLAEEFAFGKANLRLINGYELVDLVYKYYDKLDGKYKGIIPLRKVYIPESVTEE